MREVIQGGEVVGNLPGLASRERGDPGAKADSVGGGRNQLRQFVAAHEIDPIIDGMKWGSDYEEDIVSTDPFEARFTFSIDGDSIELTVTDDLIVSDVTNDPPVNIGG